MEEQRRDFCPHCRREVPYVLQKRIMAKTIRGKEYSFNVTEALCATCGQPLCPPGLIDKNIQEVDQQYRAAEGLVSTAAIKKLMQLYNLGKAPLSLALGFGEVTVPRYMEGQVPSREYSAVIREALASPAYMEGKLEENRGKLASTAYRKAKAAIKRGEALFALSEKMLGVIAYLFVKLEEITPLMLQKLLYFVQGVYSARYGRPLFPEDCQAWVHGPVYPQVYELFRDFKYNPIEDVRFALLEAAPAKLTREEKEVIDLVSATFGLYSGKVLEKLTHSEGPWLEARRGYGEEEPSSVSLPKEEIRGYFMAVQEKYDLANEAGLQNYIHALLAKASTAGAETPEEVEYLRQHLPAGAVGKQ